MESADIIVIAIGVPITVISFTLFFLFAYLWNHNIQRHKKVPIKATRVVKFDLNNRKFFLEEMGNQKFDKIFKFSKPNTWNDITLFLDTIPIRPKRKIYEIIQKLEDGENHGNVNFKIEKYYDKKTITHFDITIDRINNTNDFYICFSYSSHPMNVVETNKKINILKKNDLIKDEYTYKGFISFNVKGLVKKNSNFIIETISNIYPHRQINVFLSNGVLTFIVYGKSNFKTQRKIDKLLSLINKKGYKSGMKKMYSGSAIAISNKVDSIRNINKIMQTINFLLSASLIRGVPFISYGKEMNKTEFKAFIEASKLLRDSVDNKKIVIKKTPVKKWSSNRKIIDYIFPSVKGMNSVMFKSMMMNENYNKFLSNGFVDNISGFIKPSTPVLIDVFDSWVIENAEKIIYDKAIYVVHSNYEENIDELIIAVEKLAKKNIIIALHINDYNEAIGTIIEKAKPKFIVIDEDIWGYSNNINTDVYMKLIALNELLMKKNIKTIYQNPPEIIDKTRAAKMGLEYFYKKI